MGQPPIPETALGISFAGKTVLVTGGNSGLGYEAARQYLVLGAARVIITTRTTAKGQEAASSLRAHSSVKNANPSGVVEFFELDLDDYESVVAFSQKVKAEVSELDVLLLNGGVVLLEYQKSKTGHERVMQVNTYSNLVIALELLPLLQATAKKRGTASHLTVVGSGIHTDNSLTEKYTSGGSVVAHFDDEAVYDARKRYGDSKAAVAAFLIDLASRVPASEVIINHPCPGLVQTNLDQHLPAPIKAYMATKRAAEARPVDEGARTLIYATTAGPETHGKFLQHNAVDKDAEFLHTPAGKTFEENLWKDVVAEASKYDSTLPTAWA